MKKHIKQYVGILKSEWKSLVIACGIWTILGYLWQKGIQNAFLIVLHYLTGSLMGLEGNNVIGGAIGKAVLFVVVNGFLGSLLMHNGSFKLRLQYAKRALIGNITKVTDYTAAFSVFINRDSLIWILAISGMGLSVTVNTFITGKAVLINSFVNIALFVVCMNQIQEKRGFLIAYTNLLLQKCGYKEINGDRVIAFLDGIALGCLLAPLLYSIMVQWFVYSIGISVFVVGMTISFILMKKGGKK